MMNSLYEKSKTTRALWSQVVRGLVVMTAVAASPTVSGQAGKSTAPDEVVVIGCLQQSAGGRGMPTAFAISDYRGGPMSTFRVDPDDSKLPEASKFRVHVGHMVEVRGRVIDSSSRDRTPRLVVTSLLWLSPNC